MIHFEKKDFANEHSQILNKLSNPTTKKWCETGIIDESGIAFRDFKNEAFNLCVYRDPDSAVEEQLQRSSYYKWVTRFLNKNMKVNELYKRNIVNKNLIFVPPKLAGTGEAWNEEFPKKLPVFADDKDEGKYGGLKKDPKKILVYELNEDGSIKDPEGPYLRLSSDQLGFAAINYALYQYPKTYLFNLRRPLYRLFNLALELEEGKSKTINKFISEFIDYTRTLGGAFLWPTNHVQSGNTNPIYNVKRGVGSYIEDRADLTLLEVKCYFEGKHIFIEREGRIEEKKSVLSSFMNSQMKQFIEIFGKTNDPSSKGFENYSEFFKFNGSFVKDGVPINILTEEPFEFDEERNGYIVRGRKLQTGGEHSPKYENGVLSEIDLDAEGLNKILKRVQKMVTQRTLAMEKIVAPKN